MSESDAGALTRAIQSAWSGQPSAKAKRYIGAFFNASRTGKKIVAQVEGKHGTYTVSILLDEHGISSACSCYIGKGGGCHHCDALAFAFLQDKKSFTKIAPTRFENVNDLASLEKYLQGVTLEALIKKLSEQGITQKAFAESIRMSPRHLSAIRSSELRHHYFHELGATKLACLWVLEHIKPE
ncbi:MAG: hypothetical protein HZC40_23150 [Chloroflexi bacterium]|nr:hypothetical protein [Chloroflexota bacterium]